MKILLINDFNFGFGGAELVFLETKKLLEKNGHKVEVFGAKRPSKITPLLTGWPSIYFYLKAKEIIKIFKPDIVHVHGCNRYISPTPLIAAKQKNIPVAMTIHDFEILGPQASMLQKKYKIIRKFKLAIQRFIIKNSVDLFICPSKLLTEWTKKSFQNKNVLYLPNFAILEENQKIIIKNKSPRTFLYVGRLSKEKGIDVVIKAMSLLINKEKLDNFTLQILGEGPDKTRLQEIVKKENIERYILFKGKITAKMLLNYYEKCIAVIIPSVWRENSPLVAYEAMYAGIPVIATDVGGLPDLIENGKNGYLFKMFNEVELSGYMRLILENKNKSVEMGRNGKEKYKKNFTKEQYYIKLLNLYIKLSSK